MVGRLDFAVFIVGALLLHVAALAAFGPELSRSSGQEERASHSLKAADPELAALVELWNTPPETGDASALTGPGEEAPPPDTTDAAQAEAGVDAASEVAALGETSGPGKAPVRPIFAAPPKAKTAPPPRLALGGDQLSSLAAQSGAGPTLGAPSGLQSQSPSPSSLGGTGLAALGSGGLGSGLSLPDQPVEENFAPEDAPAPIARPDAETLAALLAAQPEDEEQPSIVIEGAPPPEDEDPMPSLSGSLGAPAAPLGGGFPSSPGGALPSLPSLPSPEPEPAEN